MQIKLRTAGPTALAALAALALAASPAAAVPGAGHGKPDKPAKPDKPGKPKGVAYVFKGTYSGESAVAVTHGNKRARDFEDQTVVFDFSAAKLSVADTTGDGVVDLADVVVGDAVVVKAKLPKGEVPTQPIGARHLVDQTHPAPDEA